MRHGSVAVRKVGEVTCWALAAPPRARSASPMSDPGALPHTAPSCGVRLMAQTRITPFAPRGGLFPLAALSDVTVVLTLIVPVGPRLLTTPPPLPLGYPCPWRWGRTYSAPPWGLGSSKGCNWLVAVVSLSPLPVFWRREGEVWGLRRTEMW